MIKIIRTQQDAWRHIATRVGIAVCCAVFSTVVWFLVRHGWDWNSTTQVNLLITLENNLIVGVLITVFITTALTYRSTAMLRELQATRAQLMQIARTDPLTGLLNRRGYDEAAIAMLATAGRRDNPAVVLMCDIDHFKVINDTFGHHCGDQVLVAIGKVIQAFGEEHGMLTARHGGEEFAVMMAGVSEVQGAQLADALRLRCGAAMISRGKKFVSVTVSIGLAAARQTITLSALMRAADGALYSAKRRGRNCVARAGNVAVLAA